MNQILKTAITPEQSKTTIDFILNEFFDERIKTAGQMSEYYARLWQSMARLSGSGGKRLRPHMAMLSHGVFGGEQDRIAQAAAAWEVLHLCLLIHDDIIDNDYIRYGVDNIAGQYRSAYEGLVQDSLRRDHLASSAAILAGDVALSSAHDLILKSMLTADEKLAALSYLTDATFMVAGGELLDTESVLYEMQQADTDTIMRYKTASYSFVGPLMMGAALAGADHRQLDIIQRFGLELGAAYQLVDDLIGVFGDPEVSGKSTVTDIREGKRTLLMQEAFRQASGDDSADLQRLVGKSDITVDEVDHVVDIVLRSGARERVQDRIDDHVESCRTLIEELSSDCPRANELAALLDTATIRRK